MTTQVYEIRIMSKRSQGVSTGLVFGMEGANCYAISQPDVITVNPDVCQASRTV